MCQISIPLLTSNLSGFFLKLLTWLIHLDLILWINLTPFELLELFSVFCFFYQKYHHRWSYSGRGTNRNGRGQWVQLLRDRTNNTLDWSPCSANNTYLEKFNRNSVLHKIKPTSGKSIANTTAQLRPERNKKNWANNIDYHKVYCRKTKKDSSDCTY